MAMKKKAAPKKAGPRPPKDESRKPLGDIGDRWVQTNDNIYSTFQFPRGNRMTKQERQREPWKSKSAWKEFKNTRRKER